MTNIQELKRYKKIYMIGIGGVSMSGIAEILKNWGFSVYGSDISASEVTDKLISNGIDVSIGHNLSKLSLRADARLSPRTPRTSDRRT